MAHSVSPYHFAFFMLIVHISSPSVDNMKTLSYICVFIESISTWVEVHVVGEVSGGSMIDDNKEVVELNDPERITSHRPYLRHSFSMFVYLPANMGRKLLLIYA